MARNKKSKAKSNKSKGKGKAKAKGKGKGRVAAKQEQHLINFHKFPQLPTELRLMIINEALHEDQKTRPARVILLDHHTCRISPLEEQLQNLPPMLFVNTQFREVALQVYVMLDLIELGIPYKSQFGHEMGWHNEYEQLEYSLDIAQLINAEANEEAKCDDGPKGHVYIRPETDIFLTGLVPRQILNTDTFSSFLDDLDKDGGEIGPLSYITQCLPLAACARISTMRDLVWDPGCPSCGEHHPVHCRECFLEGRGRHLVDPGFDTAKYSNVKEFGIYVMGVEHTPENLMYLIALAPSPTEDFLEEMDNSYVVGFPVPNLKHEIEQ